MNSLTESEKIYKLIASSFRTDTINENEVFTLDDAVDDNIKYGGSTGGVGAGLQSTGGEGVQDKKLSRGEGDPRQGKKKKKSKKVKKDGQSEKKPEEAEAEAKGREEREEAETSATGQAGSETSVISFVVTTKTATVKVKSGVYVMKRVGWVSPLDGAMGDYSKGERIEITDPNGVVKTYTVMTVSHDQKVDFHGTYALAYKQATGDANGAEKIARGAPEAPE